MNELDFKVIEIFDLTDSDDPMNDIYDIIYGESGRFRIVESEKVVRSARLPRWHHIKTVVVEDTYSESSRYIAIEFSRGKTEMQDFVIEDVSAYYVTPVERTVTVTEWIPVKE